MREVDGVGPYEVVPFRPERNATPDTLRWAKKRLQIPMLLEVDVTAARKAIRELRRNTGTGLSFTAWVISCVARAAAEHPRVHSIRRGRRELILFQEVDVAVLVEGAVSPRLQSLFFSCPAWLRDIVFWRWLLRSPTRMKRTMGTVVVTAAGMAAPGVLAWGIPLSLHPLAVGVGGIAQRSTPTGRQDVLALTIVFDHAVTHGAPVGRFLHRVHELMTRPEGFGEMKAPEE
jgi:pyruvate/2-oxoglutarate dehydrogenase complex dihydrolipoamide acyltransferase (E2) component